MPVEIIEKLNDGSLKNDEESNKKIEIYNLNHLKINIPKIMIPQIHIPHPKTED